MFNNILVKTSLNPPGGDTELASVSVMLIGNI